MDNLASTNPTHPLWKAPKKSVKDVEDVIFFSLNPSSLGRDVIYGRPLHRKNATHVEDHENCDELREGEGHTELE